MIKRSIDDVRSVLSIDRVAGSDHVAARRISERHYGCSTRAWPPSTLVTFLSYDDGFVGTSPVVFSDHRSARPELSPLTSHLQHRARDTGPFPRSAVRFVRAGEQNRGREQRRGGDHLLERGFEYSPLRGRKGGRRGENLHRLYVFRVWGFRARDARV